MDNLSNYAKSFPFDVLRRYVEKVSVINGEDPYILVKSGPSTLWNVDAQSFPQVSYPDVFNYVVLKTSHYTGEEFRAYKSLEAYNFLVSGFVSNVCSRVINNHYLIFREVCHSQRMNEANLQPWVICKDNGSVVSGHCTCIAGLGECCSHVAALLFYVEVQNRMAAEKSVTDVAAYWMQRGGSSIQAKLLKEVDFRHARIIGKEEDSNQLRDVWASARDSSVKCSLTDLLNLIALNATRHATGL